MVMLTVNPNLRIMFQNFNLQLQLCELLKSLQSFNEHNTNYSFVANPTFKCTFRIGLNWQDFGLNLKLSECEWIG